MNINAVGMILIVLLLEGCSEVKLFLVGRPLNELAHLSRSGLQTDSGPGTPSGSSSSLDTALVTKQNQTLEPKNTRGGQSDSSNTQGATPANNDGGGAGTGSFTNLHPVVKIVFKGYGIKLAGFNDKKQLEFSLLDKEGKELDKKAYPLIFTSNNPDFKVDNNGEVWARNSAGETLITATLAIDAGIKGETKVLIGLSEGSVSSGGGGGGGGGGGAAPAPPPEPPPPPVPAEDTVDGTVIFS